MDVSLSPSVHFVDPPESHSVLSTVVDPFTNFIRGVNERAVLADRG